nr:hypothetical protein [Tanacetum cinerariifolium]
CSFPRRVRCSKICVNSGLANGGDKRRRRSNGAPGVRPAEDSAASPPARASNSAA